MTPEKLRELVVEQLEWAEVLHQLVPKAFVQEALVLHKQIAVLVAHGKDVSANRYIHLISPLHVDETEYATMLQVESPAWNALSEEEKVNRAEKRVSSKWQRDKICERLKKKGFVVDVDEKLPNKFLSGRDN